MKKTYLLIIAALVLQIPVYAQTAKPCEELKSEIAKKMEANGVNSYSLEIVAKDKEQEGKVVGTCEGGTKKIVYRRGEAGSQTSATEQASAKH